MQIFVRTIDGNIFSLDVEASDIIQNVKGKIRHEEAIEIDKMRLVFDGKQLEDGRTLADYNISNDSGALHLVICQPKGGFIAIIIALCAIGCCFLLTILIPVLLGEKRCIEFDAHNGNLGQLKTIFCVCILLQALPLRSSLYIRPRWQTELPAAAISTSGRFLLQLYS